MKKESFSFSEAAVHNWSIKILFIKFCQSSLATLLKKRLQHKCISLNLAKFWKKTFLLEDLTMAGSAFCSFIYMSHLIIHFIKKVRKETIRFWINSTGLQHRRTIRKNKLLELKMQLFVIFSKEHDLKSFISAYEPAWNDWIKDKL